MPQVNVLDSTMFYAEAGTGTPLVFLHGNPTSSHLWRNVLPGIGEPGRCLAPDLIGMGRSGKPDVPYRFADHVRYLDEWFDRLNLDDVVLVGHDWVGALALDWAARHPGRTRGIVFFETIVRPFTWDDFPGPARPRLESLRTAGVGETKVLDENFFIEFAIGATVLRDLRDDEFDVYRMPYPTPESRRPLLQWPRALPIEGEPADVVARVEAYDRWLAVSDDMPKLLLTFDGTSETLLVGPGLIAWCEANVANLEVRKCGPAAHLAPEDQPESVAATIAAWLDRHELRSNHPPSTVNVA